MGMYVVYRPFLLLLFRARAATADVRNASIPRADASSSSPTKNLRITRLTARRGRSKTNSCGQPPLREVGGKVLGGPR